MIEFRLGPNKIGIYVPTQSLYCKAGVMLAFDLLHNPGSG
jgi:hypothetical protein